ncbi:hypothetical protein BJV82DRAFT_592506 [Fennellomyces sp. T-0311]|nr:hypothetical protein BJV82DRAFT_592506 [Fennellomyces sp. T-0311]
MVIVPCPAPQRKRKYPLQPGGHYFKWAHAMRAFGGSSHIIGTSVRMALVVREGARGPGGLSALPLTQRRRRVTVQHQSTKGLEGGEGAGGVGRDAQIRVKKKVSRCVVTPITLLLFPVCCCCRKSIFTMSTLEAFGFHRRKQQQPKPTETKTTCVQSIAPALNAPHPWLCASPDIKPAPIESSISRSVEKRVVPTKPKKAKGKTKKQNGVSITRYFSAQSDDNEQAVCVIRKQIPFQEAWQTLLAEYTTKRRRDSEADERRAAKKIQVDHEFLLQFQQLLCGSPMDVCDEEDRRVTLRRQMTVAESQAYIHTILQEFSI